MKVIQHSPMSNLQEGGSSTQSAAQSGACSVSPPKCNISPCMMCRIELTKITNDFPAKCPMCEGELE